MTAFLFWNVQAKDTSASLCRLAIKHDLHVISLAERPPASVDIPKALTAATGHAYRVQPNPGCDYIYTVTRLPAASFTTSRSSKRFAIYRLHPRRKPEVLVAVAHLPPKEPGGNTEDNQRSVAFDFAKRIARQERKYKHTRTVVVGDLNMNPHDLGVISADGLHAVSARKIASKASRVINARPSGPLFFNPMWRHWGDAKETPAGSFYLPCSRTDCLFWHILDQVLYRHAMTKLFDEDSLRILDGDGTESFCTNSGVPRSKFPDHFPIVFELNV